MPLMSQKSYAEKVGVSPQYVNKLVSQGKILKVGKLIDSRQADKAIKAFARSGRVIAATRSTKAPARNSNPRSASGKRAPTISVVRDSASKSLTASRAEREHYQAQSAKLDYEQRIGSLLPAEEVLAAERRKNETIRTMLRRLPRSLAPSLARITDPGEVEQRLGEEIDGLLDRLSRDPLGMSETLPIAAPEPAAISEALPITTPQEQPNV
jgi:uncharacterized protein with PIN domain